MSFRLALLNRDRQSSVDGPTRSARGVGRPSEAGIQLEEENWGRVWYAEAFEAVEREAKEVQYGDEAKFATRR